MNEAAATQDLLASLGALGDENRLRLLTLLERHELSVGELVAIVQLPQPTVSRHLKVLSDEGWIRARREGTARHYRMVTELESSARDLWSVVRAAIGDTRWRSADAERAEVVLSARKEAARRFFSETAAEWDALRGELYGPRAEWSAMLGFLDPDWTFGDLGTGTGALAGAVAPFVRHVIGVDHSPEMLQAARERLAGHANVELREGDLESLPLDPCCLDVAVLSFVLHFTVDPRRALAEAHRVLRPGGVLVVVDMREHDREEYRDTMGHLWTGFSEDDMAEWTRAAGFQSYTHTELRPDPAATGPLLFMGRARRAPLASA